MRSTSLRSFLQLWSNRTACNVPVVLKIGINLFRCVCLGLELSSAGKWISRARVENPWGREMCHYLDLVNSTFLNFNAGLESILRPGSLTLMTLLSTSTLKWTRMWPWTASGTEDGKVRKVSLTTPLKREKLLRCSLSSNPKDIRYGLWNTKLTAHPKRNLGTCPHTGCVVLDHQIYVNGKEQYTFKHRIPLEKVSALNINGDVSVNLCGFIQVSYISCGCGNIAALLKLCQNPMRMTWKVKSFLNTLSLFPH